MENNLELVEELEQSHQYNLKKAIREGVELKDLPSLFKNNTIIKLPDQYLQYAKFMRMNSSPFSSDNEDNE
jgi:gamma-glutamylcysteine synthetase